MAFGASREQSRESFTGRFFQAINANMALEF
jgi:hypothetical protein